MSGLQVQLKSSSPIRLAAEFDCGAGELVALVGPSGSGKTSMLRAIAGPDQSGRSDAEKSAIAGFLTFVTSSIMPACAC